MAFLENKQQLIVQPDFKSGFLPVSTTEHANVPGVKPYKIVLIGDGGVGKSAFIRRYLTGAYSREYIATIGAITHEATFTTDRGEKLAVQIWDTAGQEMNSGLSDVFYLGADAFIIFFDVTSRITLQNVKNWMRRALDTVSDSHSAPLPVVVCANKIDDKQGRKIKSDTGRKHAREATEYLEMSVNHMYNVEKPILICMRHILGRPDLRFVTNIDIAPKMFSTDQSEIMLQDQTLMDAAMHFIPDEDPK